MSTSERWGVNGHTRDARGLAASAGVRLRAMKRRLQISVTPRALRLGKELYFTYYSFYYKATGINGVL